MADRKPQPSNREPAQIKLNNFLKENNILIGTQSSDISTTSNGSILIGSPKIIAVYGDEVKKTPNIINSIN